MSIEFRVQGKDSAIVAQQFADLMEARFKIRPTIRTAAPSTDLAGTGADKMIDPLHATLVVLEVAVVLFHVYDKIREGYEKRREALVLHWLGLIHWAQQKLPTTIRAIIGDKALFLHEGDAEQLHDLTCKVMKDVAVIPETAAVANPAQ